MGAFVRLIYLDTVPLKKKVYKNVHIYIFLCIVLKVHRSSDEHPQICWDEEPVFASASKFHTS